MDLHLDPLTGLPAIRDDGTGTPRLLARLLGDPELMAALPDFGEHHEPMPPSEWRDISLFAMFNPTIRDQGSAGSCTGHGGGTAYTLRWLAQGEDPVEFSPCYLYGQINGGRDRGASIGDVIAALMDKGICLESTVPEGMIYARQFPANADSEASRYKLLEAYKTTDPADVATALQLGYSVADSVMVGRTFNSLDSTGMAGVDRGPGNHCICKGGMKRTARGWAYLNQNSWGARWGDGGRFLTTDDHIHAQTYYEAVCLRAVSSGPRAPVFRD